MERNFDEIEIGAAIKFFREKRGLSRKTICGTFISEKTLQNIEQGVSKPRMETLLHLASQLGVQISDLTTFEQYELIKQFHHEKSQVFEVFNAKKQGGMDNLISLLNKLDSEMLPYELKQEIAIYRLFLDYFKHRKVDSTLKERVTLLAKHYHFANQIRQRDIIFAYLFFQVASKPRHSRFYQQLKKINVKPKAMSLQYCENCYLAQTQQWQTLIEASETLLQENSIYTSIQIQKWIYHQLIQAYHACNQPVKVTEYQQRIEVIEQLYHE
ncbi:MAG: helix-turn-helix domain-containing protein [Culicoidibacterales bacterium]